MARTMTTSESSAQTLRLALGRGALGWGRWWYPAVPHGRAVVFRRIVYGFVIVDVLLASLSAGWYGSIPGELYKPLLIGRILPLPVPTPLLVSSIKIALVVFGALALTRRMPRLAGVGVFLLYLEWMTVSFSYGKVDHDRFALLVALAVLPTVSLDEARDEATDHAAGWALRCVQVAVVLTYFGCLCRAAFWGNRVAQRLDPGPSDTAKGHLRDRPLIDHPTLLIGAQYLIVAFELASPLMLAKGRWGRIMLSAAVTFQLGVYTTLRLSFLPHVVCLLAFLPLERLLSLRPSAEGAHLKET